MAGEATLFLKAGVDGYFTDYPAIGVAARDAFRPQPYGRLDARSRNSWTSFFSSSVSAV